MQFHPIEEIIADIRMGRPVVMVDDADRENEGDVIFAAQKTTPELINFMARYARGLICMPLTQEKCKQLNLPLMVPTRNGAKFGTNFTLSIEAAKDVTTGISAQDRATTILAAANPNATADDIVQPGHIFPIMAQPGGVLSRAGHTEASTDLARLAGLEATAVLCEIMNEDGTMARGDDLFAFCERHQLKIGTIADLIAYRLKKEATVHLVHDTFLKTRLGEFQLKVFEDDISKLHHYCFIKGNPTKDKEALVRVHVHQPLLDLPIFMHLRPEGWSIDAALTAIEASGHGACVLISDSVDHLKNIEQLGLLEHIQAINDLSPTEIDSKNSTAKPRDWRLIGVGSQILSALGFGKIRVLGSEKRYYGLSGFGLKVMGFNSATASN